MKGLNWADQFWFSGSLRALQYFFLVNADNRRASLLADPVGGDSDYMVPLKTSAMTKLSLTMAEKKIPVYIYGLTFFSRNNPLDSITNMDDTIIYLKSKNCIISLQVDPDGWQLSLCVDPV